MLKRLLRKTLSRPLYGYSQHELLLAKISWSQYGEDLLIANLFNDKLHGVYLDVGAYDAVNCSNTYALYRKGWNGIAVDANPDVAGSFSRFRPRDKFLNCAVGPDKNSVRFTRYENGLYNCVSGHEDAIPEDFRKVASVIEVPCRSLSTIIEDNQLSKIDLLCIDCEGEDLNVLMSNDWDAYVPSVICVEDHSLDWANSPIARYLGTLGYLLRYRMGPSSIFQKS